MALKFAVIGSGPAGFFTSKSLLKQFPNCKIDMIEKLPVPFGLIRYGVAPDHCEIKQVTQDFTALAKSPNFNFYGDISVGQDITYKTLSSIYSGVIFAHGCSSSDKQLSIPGSSHSKSAREIVEWYNSMPGSKSLNLSQTSRVHIIGNGNVAMDVARILSSPLDRLAKTDIDTEAFSALCESRIQEIDIIGRRGPVQAAMTVKELRYLTSIPGTSVRVFQDEIDKGLNLNSIKEGEISSVPTNQTQRAKRRLFDLMNSLPRVHPPDARVKINLRFLLNPESIEPPKVAFRKTSLTGELNKQSFVLTDEREVVDSDLVIRSIGYKSEKIDENLPFDEESGTVVNLGGKIENNCFVAGWARTGPFGVVDTTMRSVFYTVDSIVSEFEEKRIKETDKDVRDFLKKDFVSFDMWEKIDRVERMEGEKVGKVRSKVKDLSRLREIAFS